MTFIATTLAVLVSSVWWADARLPEPRQLERLGDSVWIGTGRGLYRAPLPGSATRPQPEPIWAGPEVRALASDGERLWIASDRGLAHWSPDAGLVPHAPLAPGAEVRDVACAEGRVYVATDSGLFVRANGAWTREGSLPPGAVDAVAARGDQVWVARREGLWARGAGGRFQARIRNAPPGWRELLDVLPGPVLVVPAGLWDAAAQPPRRHSLGPGALRAGIALPDGALALLSEREIWWLPPSAGGRSFAELDAIGARALDAGDAPLDLAPAPGGLLVLAPRGLARIALRSPPAGPAGGADPVAAGGMDGRDAGIPRGDPRLIDALPADPLLPAVLREVPIAALHAAVLRYLELTPGRMRRAEGRANRALWLPQLRVSGGLDRERRSAFESNQVFNSGGVRDLRDGLQDEEGGWSFDVQLVWDFAEGVTHDAAVQVSRERRELIELRDQVLERVDRAYFERLRVRARRLALPPDRPDERAELWVRERELAAQLDAWSGGAFSALLSGELRH